MPSQPTPRIVIDGFGLITPLGLSAWRTFRGLLAGRTLVNRPEVADPRAGGLPTDPMALAAMVGGVGLGADEGLDPTVELAERAGREALWMARRSPKRMPTWIGTSKGAITTLCNSPSDPSQLTHEQALSVALGPHGYLSHHLTRRLDIEPRANIVAACSSSLAALYRAHAYLTHRPDPPQPPQPTTANSEPRTASSATATLDPASDTALVLTAESALHPLLICSYRRLGILAPLTPASYRQLPLDERRAGFILGEVGAAVVLRRLPADQPPQPGQIELLDTALVNDGQDMIRPDPDMAALKHLIRRMSDHHQLDVIHPHGPATPDHDPAELRALSQTLPLHADSDIYAAKGALGHGLGAAGLTSLILAGLSLHAGRRPPMPWLNQPIAELTPWTHTKDHPRDLGQSHPCPRTGTHAVFTAGFGAHHAAATIKRN